MSYPLCIAHRGASGIAPENTMIAFWTAIQSADMIELDVQLKDKQLVIFHDRTLKRITGDIHGIADYTLEQLMKMDFGAWKSDKFKNTKIATLEQVLTELPDKKSLIIEIKPQGRENGRILEQRVIELLEEHVISNNSYISVRDVDTYQWMNRNFPKYPIALMQKKRSPTEYHRLLQEYNIKIAQIRKDSYSDNYYNEINRIVKRVNVYFADTPVEWQYLIDRNVSGILTNYPTLYQGYIDQIRKY